MLSHNSRLLRDFNILDFIGEGAYGDVLKVRIIFKFIFELVFLFSSNFSLSVQNFKVRHKVDTCLYAIKRIKLTHKNTLINKKIMREVKLLSSLNHENVVRYYSSWVENIEKNKRDDSDEESSLEVEPCQVRTSSVFSSVLFVSQPTPTTLFFWFTLGFWKTRRITAERKFESKFPVS